MAMDTIEHFVDFEDINPWQPSSHSVALKYGLDINELVSTGEAEIEIDTQAESLAATGAEMMREEEGGSSSGGGGGGLDDQYERSEVIKQFSTEPILGTNLKDDGSESESEDGLSPFELLARKMTDLTGDGGVLKEILRQGEGNVVPEGAIVRVHYNGYLEYSGEPYDSSRLRNQPMQFTLKKAEVILGWEVGVATMRKNELARFLVKPGYAFGELGCSPRIPPRATILFQIELLSFVDHRAADEFSSFSREERENATLDQIIAVANAEKDAGNDFFQRGIFGKAANKYNRAVRLLEEKRLKNEQEEEKWKAVLLKLYLNQSLCSLRQGKPKLAITQCRKVIDFDQKNVKAYFRLGQAHMKLGDFKKSREYLIRAGRLCPGNQEIRQELVKLDRTVKKFREVEKDTCRRMFGHRGGEGGAKASKERDNDDDGDHISPTELEEIRRIYTERFRAMKESWNGSEAVVLQPPLSKKEMQCAEQVAKDLDLLTEKIGGGALKICRQLPEEVEEHLRRP